MSEIDTSDYVTIKITKAKYNGEPYIWYLDVNYSDEGEEFAQGGTGPTFGSVFDMAYDIIHGGYKNNWDINEWTDFDANEKNR